jgi:molybdopterin/thiamine biosynthesis adenylyltransferase
MANNIFHHEEIYRGNLKDFAKSILVCGCGAVGSNLLDSLSRQGFSRLSTIDMDRVEKHNISTQVWNTNDVGQLKTRAIEAKIYNNVGLALSNVINKKLEEKNADKLLRGYNLIVDGFDNTEARQIVTDFGRRNNVAVLHVGLFEDYAEVVWNPDYKVPQTAEGIDVCDYPLARNIINLAVAVASDEIVRYCTGTDINSWSMTLKDFKVRCLK